VRVLCRHYCILLFIGKSYFLNKILLNWTGFFPNDRISRVILVHKFGGQECYDELRRHFGTKLIMTKQFDKEILQSETDGGTTILILDDVLHEIVNESLLATIITGGCHHLRICTFIIGHQLFASRHVNWQTITRNVTMLALFQSPRDMSILSYLNRQLYPKTGGRRGCNYVSSAYELARKDQLLHNNNPYGYLLVDCSIGCSPKYRLRTGLLPADSKFCYAVNGD
jgi:hypothetical protein